jgi:ABC-type antimicrobial peptide transport system permease subunit
VSRNDPPTVIRMVLRHELRLVVAGSGIGIVGALTMSQLMSGLLYDVSPTDPLTFAFITALLSVVALAACYIPARRVVRVDPIITPRY